MSIQNSVPKWGSSLKNSGLRLAMMVTITVAVIGCKQAAKVNSTEAASVDAAQVITKDIRVADDFNGRVSATNNVDIRPRVTGYIDRIAFRDVDRNDRALERRSDAERSIRPGHVGRIDLGRRLSSALRLHRGVMGKERQRVLAFHRGASVARSARG